MANRIQFRRDSAQRWASINPVLMEGEIGFETDTNHFKLGNGTDAWNSLEYGLGIENITSELGSSENLAASQKLVTEELNKKLCKDDVVQSVGSATDKVISQKGINDLHAPLNIKLADDDTDITENRKDYDGNRCFISSTAEAGEAFDDSVQGTDYSTYCRPFRFEVIPTTELQITLVTFAKYKNWFFVDEQGIIISTSELPMEVARVTSNLTVPANAKYLYIQTYTPGTYPIEQNFSVKYISEKHRINAVLEKHNANLESLDNRFQILKSGQNMIPDGVEWDSNKYITQEGIIEESTTYGTCVCKDMIVAKPCGKYHYATTSAYPINFNALGVAVYDKNRKFIYGVTTTSTTDKLEIDVVMPKEAAYIRLGGRNANAGTVAFTYIGENSVNDTAATACESYYDNSDNRILASNVQAAIDEIVYERDGYAPKDKLNLASASMECNLMTYYLNTQQYTSDPLVPFIADDAVNYKDSCGIVVEGLAGHGRIIPEDRGLKILFGDAIWYTYGFWIRLSDFAETDKLYLVEANGAGMYLTYSDMLKSGSTGSTTSINYYKAVVKVADYNGYSYVQVSKLTDFRTLHDGTSISLRDTNGTFKQFYVHNFTSFVGTWDINPFIHYTTLPEKFGSHCVGKVLCLTGDSNGGGGVGTWKRLSWAARFLGLPMINASNGGWSMQARMLSDEASNYGWLYYHKWREKILATKADIYYFNQCTNDACMGRDESFADGLWQTLDMDNFGSSYGATKATAYGTYGSGEYVEIKKVLETYTDGFAKLLEAGDLQAMYNDEKLITILRRDMTTLGCTGAFIAQIHSEQPKAKCIVDSTVSSIGCINSLIGSFNASGIVSTSQYESDSNGDVVYPPALLSEIDDDGYVMTYISNGTLTGAKAVTAITDASTLADGNNYSLYYYYMYKQYGINPDTTSATAEQISEVCKLCHQYYEDNIGSTYVRTTPLNLMKCAAFTMRGQAICNQIYREGVARLQSLLRVPFIDTGYATNISLWNVGHIAADAGHYTDKGMKRLGNYIATQINQFFLPDEDAFKEEYGDDYEDYFGE